jgi:pimeloyl-ACP methyl ester carboxylesterase
VTVIKWARPTAAISSTVACLLGMWALSIAGATERFQTRGPTATTVTPTGDAFYLVPIPLPSGKPGALIRAEPIDAPVGARAWRVLSHTKSLTGEDAALSGVVIAPEGPTPKGGRPIVAWAHGTTGLADGCAPSKTADVASRLPWVRELLAAGYVVAATDYQGLGTPGVHPYLVGESEGRSVLDTARVARRLPTGAGKRVVVAGHSQGGHAALFAGEIAANYAPELKLLGVAAGAPVTDVEQFLDVASGSPFSAGFLVMGAQGYQVAYPQLARAPLLTASAAARADVAVHGCVPQVMAAFARDDMSTLFTQDPAEVEVWRQKLHENSAGNRRSGAPVLLWQGDADILTPAAINASYAPKACAKGSVVDYREYAGADHITVMGAAQDDVLEFFSARLAGEKPQTSCA